MLFLVVCCYLWNHNLKQFLSIPTSNENEFSSFFLVHFCCSILIHFTFCWFHSWILCMVIIIVNIRVERYFQIIFIIFPKRYDFVGFLFFIFATIPIYISALHCDTCVNIFTCQVFLKILLFHIYASPCFREPWFWGGGWLRSHTDMRK